jgi:hypothetical protein
MDALHAQLNQTMVEQANDVFRTYLHDATKGESQSLQEDCRKLHRLFEAQRHLAKLIEEEFSSPQSTPPSDE